MESLEEILKSMKSDMLKYQKEFDDTTAQINDIAQQYTEKIEELQKQRLALQEEGNKKIEVLNARRSQLSGMHLSLFEQYKKIAGKEPDFSDKDITNVVDVKQASTAKAVKSANAESVVTTDVKPNTEVVKNESKLSSEDIEKLSEIANITSSKDNVDANGNEIPDYLVDSYKK